MFRRLSIFSFDTLRSVPRPTRVFWLTLGLCIVLRLLMTAAADRLDRIPAQWTNKRMMYLEQKVVRENPVHPRIALMGSSLMRYGLVEEQVAAAAGVRPDEVVNLGLENGCAFDALLLLRRNPQFSANLRLVIYEIRPGDVSLSSRTRRLDAVYQHFTLSERLLADRWSDLSKLVLDWVWPYHSQRRDLPGWLAGLRGEAGYAQGDGIKPGWRTPLFDRLKAHASKYDSPPSPESVMTDGRISHMHLRLLNDLIAFCRERSIRLHFVITPHRQVYDQVAMTEASSRAALVRFERLIADLGVPTTCMDRAPLRDAIGLDDRVDFLDYSHLTPEGARKLTRAVTTDLQVRGVLPLEVDAPGPLLTRASTGTPLSK